jgi:hypothetical protein
MHARYMKRRAAALVGSLVDIRSGLDKQRE